MSASSASDEYSYDKNMMLEENMKNKIVSPSTYDLEHWMWAFNTSDRNKRCGRPATSGKWMIFRPQATIDDVWLKISAAVENGDLGGVSKVSTKLAAGETIGPWISLIFLSYYVVIYRFLYDFVCLIGNGSHVICVYTYDHTDEADVFRVRQKLRELTLVEELGYKTDQATLAGQYRKHGNKKICKYRS